MVFVVVYDANVLYPSTMRDLLIRIAQSGMVQAKWTDQILDEVFTSLAARRPDLDPDRLARTRALMCRAVRDCLVVGYQDLVAALELPDPDDRHVLAAASRSGAQTIVTNNLRDFPPTALARWNVEARTPDDFIIDQLDIDAGTVHVALQRIADSWRHQPAALRTYWSVWSARVSCIRWPACGPDLHGAAARNPWAQRGRTHRGP